MALLCEKTKRLAEKFKVRTQTSKVCPESLCFTLFTRVHESLSVGGLVAAVILARREATPQVNAVPRQVPQMASILLAMVIGCLRMFALETWEKKLIMNDSDPKVCSRTSSSALEKHGKKSDLLRLLVVNMFLWTHQWAQGT
eukprot:5147077-Amphidinium_carterae.1